MTAGEMTERARGAVLGLALGDALGMTRRMEPPAQGTSRSRSQPRLGEVSATLRQAVSLGWLLPPAGAAPDHDALAAAWTPMLDRDLIEAGDPLEDDDTARALLRRERGGAETGAAGVDAAAAVRAVMFGLVLPADPAAQIAAAVAGVTALTHDTRLGQSGAAGVAAGISGGLEGADAHTQLGLLLNAADLGAANGVHVPGPDLGTRVQWATALVGRTQEDPSEILDVLIGTSALMQEAVPAALALVSVHADDPWGACQAAASLGGASPLIGGITGALLGSRHGSGAFPKPVVDRLLAAHPDLRLVELADALLAVRPTH
ncbi:ADP-ribosylglycohydrolase family protein [Gephyromycinifex aptenodytis]|uniref:ADP-ribosylglycohydrolase family protein n=1 Tax=Gephyromycinifex aptenodytis TaxID=2716227 RepID=UPI0014477814|nr:ADP-ribosylglycohydrolase family protein [Gephyromycinifex aptenodytis]